MHPLLRKQQHKTKITTEEPDNKDRNLLKVL